MSALQNDGSSELPEIDWRDFARFWQDHRRRGERGRLGGAYLAHLLGDKELERLARGGN